MKPATWGNACVVIAALLWGTTGTAAHLAPQLSPITIACVAMGGGGILQALIAYSAIIRAREPLRQHYPLLLCGAGAVAIYPLAFYNAMDCAGVALGTVISIGSAPLFSALIENRVDGAHLSIRWWCGALLGALGIALLASTHAHPMIDNAQPSLRFPLGIGLGLLAGLTYALYSWTARRMMVNGIARAAAMGATFGVGGLLLLPLLFYTGAPLLQSWHNAGIGAYMALFPMCIGYICYGAGLARIRASVATVITLLEPVIAALLAVIILGERLTSMGWLGIVIIISSLGIIIYPNQRVPSL
ncbi:DMT family transporter [Rosenbergiella australiborealis]|uniref:Threonine/homoserine exporter RhtA n=1 Tax=Rosenbergiella australiborealis TaxID=1544696 RepID=A0ABS5T2L2_9GAMM|nr:DMT family transporter [Rosenbergiella australiborealis]MBT0726576.1 EamA family transporter [Rosenbergiella australiborealis]